MLTQNQTTKVNVTEPSSANVASDDINDSQLFYIEELSSELTKRFNQT